MPIYGIDISHHQGSFDVERAAREGIDFFIFKATEGNAFIDSRFAENVTKARRTGKPFAAYHYQRAAIPASAQVSHITKVVPRDIPVIPDVEANSGSVTLTRDIVNRLRRAGYHVPLLYLPRWYWRQIGSPDLRGLPPLWSSRYPDNNIDDIRAEYRDVPGHYWDGYGGLQVAVLQFTSSARVAGRSPIDGNAYRGTLDQLRALLTGGDDMPNADDIAKAVWRYWILNRRFGKKEYAETLLGSSEDRIIRQHIAPLRGQVTGLTELMRQLAGREDLDLEAVKEAAKAGTLEALEAGAVEVDVDVTVPADNDPQTTHQEGGDQA